jgi:pyruvate kinase
MDKQDLNKEQVDEEVSINDKKGFVIATLGPVSRYPETLIKMIDNGMNIVRLRLCQGPRKKQVIMLEYLKEAFIQRPHKK